MGTELFHAGGRTDVMKLIFAFCNVWKATIECRLLRTQANTKKKFLPSITNFKTQRVFCTCINTYNILAHTVAKFNQQTIVNALFVVLLLTDNIISLRESVLNKQLWDYSYMNNNKIGIVFLFMTEVLDIQYLFSRDSLSHSLSLSIAYMK